MPVAWLGIRRSRLGSFIGFEHRRIRASRMRSVIFQFLDKRRQVLVGEFQQLTSAFIDMIRQQNLAAHYAGRSTDSKVMSIQVPKRW